MNSPRNYHAGIARVVLVVLAVFFALKLVALMTICGAISLAAFTASDIAIGVMGLIATGLIGALLIGCIVAVLTFAVVPSETEAHVSHGGQPPTLAERLAGALFAACGSALVALFFCILMVGASATWQDSVLVFATTLSLGTTMGYALPRFACDFADTVFSIVESFFD